jgi:hypothetical protein
MFLPHPSTSPRKESKSSDKKSSTQDTIPEDVAAIFDLFDLCPGFGKQYSEPAMSMLKITQFAAPAVGLFLYMAAYASDDWVVTDGPRKWGLLTRCAAQTVNNTTVTCTYRSPSENPGEFQSGLLEESSNDLQ